METKKSKGLRTASRLIGYIGSLICLALIGLEVYGLMMLEGTVSITVPFVEGVVIDLLCAWQQVYIIAAVMAVIILFAIILRVAAKKAKAAPAAEAKNNAACQFVENAKAKAKETAIGVADSVKAKAIDVADSVKAKAADVADTVKAKAKEAINVEEIKAKVTSFVKENSAVIIAVIATAAVTATLDRAVMRKKIKKIRRR